LKLKTNKLNSGFYQKRLNLPKEVESFLVLDDYKSLDSFLRNLLSENNLIFNELSEFIEIKNLEFLIAIRDGSDDEEGIWHDDGSRELAFTLSLTLKSDDIIGGNLLLRKKSSPESSFVSLPTPKYGTLTIMCTGKQGFEHRVQRVTKGKRVICAGWINSDR
jgi:hypothetical protein